MMKSKILVIGSINIDFVIRVPYIPIIGETIMGQSIERIAGGKGANQAFTAAKLGASVTMLGKVGGDEFGAPLIKNLQQVGVHTDYIHTEAGASSGLAIINVNDEGDNSIVVLSGANELCDTSYIRAHEHLFQEAEVVILQMEIPEETVYQAIDLARKYNSVVILNPAPAPDSIHADVWSKIDYLIPNETELQKLSGMDVHSIDTAELAAKKLLSQGVKQIIVTLGSKGSLFVNANETIHFPAPIVKVVDTTAAGDSFVAAFAVGLTEGKSEKDAIAFAIQVSSMVVTRAGAQRSIPDRKEVDAVD
ncbi:ribokinase [Paenibacillus eucommiae]|uniref:Ribokinase n=1 Tax=Paenibacillus eucommiae TaxID=1355755 RepID=A0ABS4J9V5_9BACL|nr:ribokinase [Paenibacillus eucommiae]MBP1996637.1 ribokinase [Paenibacillus eucommiae]